MALRFSGRVRLNVSLRDDTDPRHHNSVYVVTASVNGQRRGKVRVHPPAHLTHALDSKKAYDEAASAALSFLDHEGRDVSDDAEHDGQGWVIRTSPR